MNSKNHKPSQILRNWLDHQYRILPAGSRLPTSKSLAEKFSVSPRTTDTILKEYVEKGCFIRVQGKGTFIPDKRDKSITEIEPSKTSAQNIADILREAISLGDIKAGERLPSVKYMILQYHVTPSTIKKAYEMLEKDRLLFRMGRSYQVGKLKGSGNSAKGKEIYLFFDNQESVENSLKDDEFFSSISEFERILSEQGYILHYLPKNTINTESLKWFNRGHIPYGIMLFKIVPGKEIVYIEKMKEILSKSKRQYNTSIPVVIDFRGGHIFKQYPGISIFNAGALSTESSRKIAQFLLSGKYKRVTVFAPHHLKPGHFWNLARLVKIFSETGFTAPDIEVTFSVLDAPLKKQSIHEYLEKYYRPYKFLQIMQKHGKIEEGALEQIISLESSLEKTLRNHLKSDIWLFSTMELARMAQSWCRINGIAIPKDTAILSLEDNHAYFFEGISFCGPDLRALGYLMAHAIIGDISIVKTRKGYVRSPVQLIERQTTR